MMSINEILRDFIDVLLCTNKRSAIKPTVSIRVEERTGSTDGFEVIIGEKYDFPTKVALTLHETGHLLLSDFVTFYQAVIEANKTSFTLSSNIAELEKKMEIFNRISKDNIDLTKNQEVVRSIIKRYNRRYGEPLIQLTNILEDRIINNTVFGLYPGLNQYREKLKDIFIELNYKFAEEFLQQESINRLFFCILSHIWEVPLPGWFIPPAYYREILQIVDKPRQSTIECLSDSVDILEKFIQSVDQYLKQRGMSGGSNGPAGGPPNQSTSGQKTSSDQTRSGQSSGSCQTSGSCQSDCSSDQGQPGQNQSGQGQSSQGQSSQGQSSQGQPGQGQSDQGQKVDPIGGSHPPTKPISTTEILKPSRISTDTYGIDSPIRIIVDDLEEESNKGFAYPQQVVHGVRSKYRISHIDLSKKQQLQYPLNTKRTDNWVESFEKGKALSKKFKLNISDESPKAVDYLKRGKLMPRLIGQSQTRDNIFRKQQMSQSNRALFVISLDISGSMTGELTDSITVLSAFAHIFSPSNRYRIKIYLKDIYRQIYMGIKIFDSDHTSLIWFKTLCGHLTAQGSTPEAMCYPALIENDDMQYSNRYQLIITDGGLNDFDIAFQSPEQCFQHNLKLLSSKGYKVIGIAAGATADEQLVRQYFSGYEVIPLKGNIVLSVNQVINKLLK